MDQIQSDPVGERIILAYCLMVENLEPLGDLDEEHFASYYNRLIVRYLKQLTEQSKTWNLASVAAELADGRNGNQVPASYVAGLSDGVPLGMHNLEPQRERLRDVARRRQAMAQAELLRGQLERGASLGDVLPAALEILKRVQLSAPAAEGSSATDSPCPTPPEAVWHRLARLYKDSIGGTTEAPDSYHLACFLTVVGATLGRSVYNVDASSEPLYTNLFRSCCKTSSNLRQGTT